MISPEKFFEKFKNSGLSTKDVFWLFWSIAYSIILEITGKSLSISEIEKEYKIQNDLFKKINLEAIPAAEKSTIEELFANEQAIKQKVKTEKLAPHESSLNNRISHYKLLLRFSKEDEKEAKSIKVMIEQARTKQTKLENEKNVQKTADKAVESALKEPVSPPKKGKSLLTIAALTALGITGAFIVNRFVKKNKKEEGKSKSA